MPSIKKRARCYWCKARLVLESFFFQSSSNVKSYGYAKIKYCCVGCKDRALADKYRRWCTVDGLWLRESSKILLDSKSKGGSNV